MLLSVREIQRERQTDTEGKTQKDRHRETDTERQTQGDRHRETDT